MRAYPLTRTTLCSEPVVAWAVRRGRDDVTRDAQEQLWKLFGTERAVCFIAEKMRLEEIAPSAAAEGDAVLLHCGSSARVLGLEAGAFRVAATRGRVHIGRFEILRAWSLQ